MPDGGHHYLLPLEAELAKLFNNVHRYIKFSIANQFYEIASDYAASTTTESTTR